MKKIVVSIILAAVLLSLCGCTAPEKFVSKNTEGQYVICDQYIVLSVSKPYINDVHMCIAYDKDTKIVYDILTSNDSISLSIHYIVENGNVVPAIYGGNYSGR